MKQDKFKASRYAAVRVRPTTYHCDVCAVPCHAPVCVCTNTAPERRRCPMYWCWRKIRIPPVSWLNADHFYQPKKTILQTYWSQRSIFFQRLFSNLLLWEKLQVLAESIFYYWFSILCFCTFTCYSKIVFNLNLPHFFLIKTKAEKVIFWPQG